MLNLLRYQTSLASHVELPNTAWENSMIIKSLYGLTPPTQKEMADRDVKVAKAIKDLGHKYLLSKPLPRIR